MVPYIEANLSVQTHYRTEDYIEAIFLFLAYLFPVIWSEVVFNTVEVPHPRILEGGI